jgi:protein-L-isoaspartate O-methyltransferase
MFDMMFLVKDIDNFINLVGVGAGKGYYLIVLSHLVEKVLGMWPENVIFRLLRAVAKNLDDINDKCGPLINGLSQVRIRSNCEEGQALIELRHA